MKNQFLWICDEEVRRFQTKLASFTVVINETRNNGSPSWLPVTSIANHTLGGSGSLLTNQFRSEEMVLSTVKKTGHLKAISQTINMTQGGVAILSREPNAVQLMNSHQVKSGLKMDPNSQQSQGNYHTLQLCQVVPALQDVFSYWRMLVNLTGPGPYSRRDARVIYMLHQQLGEKALEGTDSALKGLMIVSAEENIAAHMDRVSQLFLNVIALYESALKFTKSTWDAIHEMRRRLEQYLGGHEFGAPH